MLSKQVSCFIKNKRKTNNFQQDKTESQNLGSLYISFNAHDTILMYKYIRKCDLDSREDEINEDQPKDNPHFEVSRRRV